jgi:dUTP pyrophosphatase
MKNSSEIPVINFIKTNCKAVSPRKAYTSDIGYDLTAIEVFKVVNSKTTLYSTGIIVIPPDGYYTEILPRSSISKTGYMLSNSVGVIDPSYTGELLIALTKVIDDAPDLEIPFVRCQLILRKAEVSNIVEVENIKQTTRGSGGFGSTDGKE